MTILTSNFAHTCKAINPVAISRTMPKGISIPQYRPLMPSWSLLMDYRDHRITTEGYVRRYSEELSRSTVIVSSRISAPSPALIPSPSSAGKPQVTSATDTSQKHGLKDAPSQVTSGIRYSRLRRVSPSAESRRRKTA